MRKEKGSALVTVVITVAVLAILGSAIAAAAWQRMDLAVSYANLNGAMYAAQAGVEEMKATINGLLPACNTYVVNEIQQFIESDEYIPDMDLSTKAREYTRDYLMSYLAAIDPATGKPRVFYRDLGQKGAAYTVQFAQKDYDNSTDPRDDFITINSVGTYGLGDAAVSKTVSARMRIRYLGSFEVVIGDGETSILMNQPVIINEYAGEPFSVRANSEHFKVIGPFYIPRGIHDLADDGQASLEYTDDVVVDDNLVLQGKHRETEVNGDLFVNGDLKIGELEKKMTLNVGGDLIVNGDIIIDGHLTNVAVRGNLRCNGKLEVENKTTLTVYGDAFIRNRIDDRGTVRIYGNTMFGQYGGVVPPVQRVTIPVDVFTPENGAIVNMPVINSDMGTPFNPVVIFYDGDITIDMSEYKPNSQMNINGVICATGKIIVTGNDKEKKVLYIRGNIITGRKLDIIGGDGTVVIELDRSITERIDKDILKGFGGGDSTIVRIASATLIDRWEE